MTDDPMLEPAPARRFSRPASAGRRNAFRLSMLAALAINIAALGVAAAATALWRGAPPAGRNTSWIAVVDIDASAASLPALSAARTASTAATSSTAVAPPRRPESVRAATASPDGADETARFYRSSEVDSPANSDSDWNLDSATLDLASLNRVVFDVFINDSGEVVACRVLEPTLLTEADRALIESHLLQATGRPAMRAGHAVASMRRIEVETMPSQY